MFCEAGCVLPPQISESVLVSGEHLSRKFRVQNHSPLMYEWYQEQYVGAAHGLAGIYYYLMQVERRSCVRLQEPFEATTAFLYISIIISSILSRLLGSLIWSAGSVLLNISS